MKWYNRLLMTQNSRLVSKVGSVAWWEEAFHRMACDHARCNRDEAYRLRRRAQSQMVLDRGGILCYVTVMQFYSDVDDVHHRDHARTHTNTQTYIHTYPYTHARALTHLLAHRCTRLVGRTATTVPSSSRRNRYADGRRVRSRLLPNQSRWCARDHQAQAQTQTKTKTQVSDR